MIVRIVRMTFAPNRVDQFLETFDEVAPQIRAAPGCQHLELWRDLDTPHVLTTYSHWDSQDALDDYRNSELFTTTWSTVKTLFDERPRAQSYTVARTASSTSP